MADEASGASTAAPPRIKTIEEREMDLKVEAFKRESRMLPHFPNLPPDHQLNQIWEFSSGIVGSKFVCEAARENVEDIFFIVSMAADLGLKWTHGVRSIYMTPNGKAGMEGNIMLALLYQHKFKVRLKQRTPEVGEYWICRPGDPDEAGVSVPCTFKDAEAFGWCSEKKNPWKDRANMLAWRSLAATARIVAADLLGGIYLPDELEDFDPPAPYNRETKETAADKAAEADPRLELKRIEATPASQVIDISTKQPEKQPEPVLSPQEARNEAFLSKQGYSETEKKEKATRQRKATAEPAPAPAPAPAKQTPAEISKLAEINAEEKGISDDDLPRQNDTDPIEVPQSTPAIDAKAKLAERFKEFTDFVCGSNIHITKFCAGYLGNKEDLQDLTKLDAALTVLEKTFNSLTGEQLKTAQKIYLEDPMQFARNVKVQQQSAPAAPAPATADDDTTPIDDMLPEEWAAEVCVAAYTAMQKRGLDRDRFGKVLRSFDIAKLPEQDALAFFKLYAFAVDATMLAKLSWSKNYPIAKCLVDVEQQLKAPLTDKTPFEIAIRAITNVITEVSSMEVVK